MFMRLLNKQNIMDYKDLEVWQECRKLVAHIYSISKGFPFTEKFGLTAQINRSSISVVSNIAEACGRQSSKSTLPFLYISRGSLYELETQVFLSLDQNFISTVLFNEIMEQIISCKKLLNGFIRYHSGLINSQSTNNQKPSTRQ